MTKPVTIMLMYMFVIWIVAIGVNDWWNNSRNETRYVLRSGTLESIKIHPKSH